MDNVKRRDPKNINNKMSLAEVQTLAPSIDWNGYLKAVKAPVSDHYIVTTPDFFRATEKLINDHPLDHWKAYLRWQVIHRSAPYLTKAMVDENFDFFSHTLAGAEQQLPRWRRCVHAADRDLGEALGQAYVDRAFPPESKARTLQMVHAIETALTSDIQSLSWMSPETKEQAVVKLKGIEDKIGYPSHWRDYSNVKVVRDSYLNNAQQASSAEFERWVAKIGKPVDRSEWTMTPPTINAYYDPQLNTINFPAGILQPPFFDPSKDDAVNFGAIGMVIGHEIIHGFDDEGDDGWTYRQRFFLSNAYSWCANVRPQIARLIVTSDPHSLPIFRIDNVMSNMPEFEQAFSCKAGQKMVRANACRVW